MIAEEIGNGNGDEQEGNLEQHVLVVVRDDVGDRLPALGGGFGHLFLHTVLRNVVGEDRNAVEELPAAVGPVNVLGARQIRPADLR